MPSSELDRALRGCLCSADKRNTPRRRSPRKRQNRLKSLYLNSNIQMFRRGDLDPRRPLLGLEFGREPSVSDAMTQSPDLRCEPLRSIYDAMTEVLEAAGAAQERGDAAKAARLCEDATILGKAIGILARAAGAKLAAR